MLISFGILRKQTKNAIPLGSRFSLIFAVAGTDSGPVELHGAHFHPEIVSLPQHPVPMNNAPIGTGRSECCSASPLE